MSHEGMSRLHGMYVGLHEGQGRTGRPGSSQVSPVRFGQLGGFGNASLSYSEDDLACSPAVYRGQRLSPGSGELRASSSGRQARAGGHGSRDVPQPQDLGRVATGK
jgi:hypothetical protein